VDDDEDYADHADDDEMDHVQDAQSYEHLAAEYPDQRGFLLLNAADAWLPDVPAGYARVELADIALTEGRRDEAARLLADVARETATGEGPCEIAAIVLAGRGDVRGALRWYDHYVSRLRPAQIAELGEPDGGQENVIDGLQRRRDLRRNAGLPPDAFDDLIDGLRPQPQHVPVRERAERAAARRDRPSEHPDPDEVHYPAVERLCRAMAECGVPRITIVAGRQRTIPWPPQRNAPCWCGFGPAIQGVLPPGRLRVIRVSSPGRGGPHET
jgi:hypothetical protein